MITETPILPAPAQPDGPIHNSLTVAEINRSHPECQPVFQKYGIAGCGGEYGPPEPLFIFAAAHRVPLRELVDELNQAVRGEWRGEPESKAAAATREEVVGENLYKQYVAAALLVALTAGFGLGVVNLTRIALGQSYYAISGVLKQVHGHAQIFGWVGLFIMAVAFHAVPRMKMMALRPVAAVKACLGLMLAGVLLRVVSQPWAANPWWSAAMLGSAALELVATGLFVWLIGRVVWRSEQPREFHEKFVWASVGWLAVLGTWNFWVTLGMYRHRSVGIPALADALFIHAALFGFIANMIFGFSLRVLPHFLGLREPKVWAANVAFVLWNAAILLRYPIEKLAWTASTLELVAAVLVVWGLGIFARRRTKIEIQGVDNAFGWFIRLGYAWLLVAAVTPFHADLFRLSASARHTMAVGFITAMILGVGHRVLPVFNGVSLWSNRLMRVTFWLYTAGSTIAFAMAFSVVYPTPATFAWTGISGYLVFSAVALFAWNLWKTLQGKAESYARGAAVTLQTRVAELLETYPDIRPVLIHGGLAGLASMDHNPPRFVTVEFAARRHGIDPQPLIAALNGAIDQRKKL